MTSAALHLGSFVDFTDYGSLVVLLRNSLIAGAILGLLGGLVSTCVIARDMPFAVHGISELSFAGASGALLLGGSVVLGSFVGALLAAVTIGLLGIRASQYNSVLGVLMPFGLGLGILFLALYQGRAANKFGLLTGQIVAIDNPSLVTLSLTAVGVSAVLLTIWRPLLFASVDPEVATAAGVPVRGLAMLFMVLLGCTVAVSIQIVGALLVLALLCTPAAAATQVTASPFWVPVASIVFALVAMVGGTLLALGTTVPVSPFVTTISFVIYLGCRIVRGQRDHTVQRRQPARA
jgi:zinc/manganese transport system permease protein